MQRPVSDSPLFITVRWVQAHCIVPDGFDKGKLIVPVEWQEQALLNFYLVRGDAKGVDADEYAAAFRYRRSQIVLPQKAGKAPYTGTHICVEGVGPALFAGWAKGGEVWDCRDHGCGCGWSYEYEPGEAMGVEWPTPLIQITATSEDQTDNIYSALRPMIDDGPLHDLIPKTGEEFIRLPRDGRIDVVTSNARSRLGARCTYVPQDETGIWLPSNGMVTVAETQRRGLAGMGGRAEETTNAWDPSEESVAQRTAEAKVKDIFRIHPQAPTSLSYRNKAERRKIHRTVYKGCKWVNLDSIEAEAAELLETDPAQAERFFGNRAVAGTGWAFNPDIWDSLARPDYHPAPGALIVLGVDGARFVDSLAVIATEIATGFQWPIGIWERPENAPDDYEHPFDEVDAAVIEAEQDFTVWRIYIDPGSSTGNIDPLVEKWLGRWGEKRVHKWFMYRPRPTAVAVSNYIDAVASAEVTHSGDETFSRHIKNAVRQKVSPRDEKTNQQLFWLAKDRRDSPRRIDAAAAGTLSWEGRGDAIAEAAGHDPSKAIKHTDLRDVPDRENVVRRGDLVLHGEKYVDRDRADTGPRRGR